MKKLIALLLSLIMVFSLLTACGTGLGDKDTSAQNGEKDSQKPFRVCLIVALLGTKSFADFAYDGCKQAEADFGIDLTVSECEDPSLYENQLLTACEEGYDLIICGASQWKDYIAAHAAEYPDTLFGISDTRLEGVENVFSITFAQNQGSFLAGAAAAMFTEMTEFEGVNEDAIIGWIGGNDIPALRDFFVGYQEGAKYINPNIQILQSYAGDFQDAVKGKELSYAMYDQGADIIMNVAGNTGLGIHDAAAETGHYSIGVDKNQDGLQPGHILTSMLKENSKAVYYMIEQAINGTYPGGQHLYMDLGYGAVSLTDFSVFMDSCTTEEQKQQVEKIKAAVAELSEKIISGEIVVSNYEGYGPN